MSATPARAVWPALSLAALGVVYGDIGTSPLYALKEVFGGAHHPVPITPDNVLGILSLIFWSLMIVVSLKYVTFITARRQQGRRRHHGLDGAGPAADRAGLDPAPVIVILGLFGAALFYGDGVITPRFRCSRRSRAWRWRHRPSSPTCCRSR
jgi:KUP system potassium uptake protein